MKTTIPFYLNIFYLQTRDDKSYKFSLRERSIIRNMTSLLSCANPKYSPYMKFDFIGFIRVTEPYVDTIKAVSGVIIIHVKLVWIYNFTILELFITELKKHFRSSNIKNTYLYI